MTDPRYLAVTVEEMLTDLMSHDFARDPKLLDEVEDEDFDPDELERRLNDGEPPVNDWEPV